MEENKQAEEDNIVDSSVWITMSTKQLYDQLALLKERRATLVQLGKVVWMKPLDTGILQLELLIQQKTTTMLATRKIRPNTAIIL